MRRLLSIGRELILSPSALIGCGLSSSTTSSLSTSPYQRPSSARPTSGVHNCVTEALNSAVEPSRVSLGIKLKRKLAPLRLWVSRGGRSRQEATRCDLNTIFWNVVGLDQHFEVVGMPIRRNPAMSVQSDGPPWAYIMARTEAANLWHETGTP